MSHTAGSAVSSTPAPWRSTFLSHISKMDSPEFVLSTVAKAPAGASTPYVPRARYCIYRGMWAELPENKHNDAPKNERVYESDLPTFTSDVRMDKIADLFASSAGHADSEDQIQGSGGGGPVEAVWWIKEVMTQWRIKGEAFVVGPDIEGSGDESSGVRTVKSEVAKRMRVVKEEKEADWSWQTEMTGHFGNISPGMRGSFKQPPPGQPKDKPYNDKDEKMGEKITSLDEPVARKNFRVVIIRPQAVEMTDLTDPGSAKRIQYTFDHKSGGWSTQETWP